MIIHSIDTAAEELRKGGLVVLPTETVYGLAADAFNPEAVKEIFRLKQRPMHNPLIVHLSSVDQLEEIAEDIPESAWLLAGSFWPGPLTLVLKKKSSVPDVVSAGKATVAVRVPEHEMCRKVIEVLGSPVAAPSANPFGMISPTKPSHVLKAFGDHAPPILDGGICKKGIESTIVSVVGDEPVLLRHGAVSYEELSKVTGTIAVKNSNNIQPDAPGMLDKHYSPATPSYLVKNVEEHLSSFLGKRIGTLTFTDPVSGIPAEWQKVLSPEGSLAEAASRLYQCLHELDELMLDVLLLQQLPQTHLGISVNDRLKRATLKSLSN